MDAPLCHIVMGNGVIFVQPGGDALHLKRGKEQCLCHIE